MTAAKTAPMPARTLKALKASIKHWEENVAAETVNDASVKWRDCALCRLFYENSVCSGCPVFARTGSTACEQTPYNEAKVEYDEWEWHEDTKYRTAFRKAARAELKFLRSLLPKVAK